ncbi:TetR/AcrR family transcriptional regulator [Paeniglutamicibacter kerguelensis]|uniref:AcrR family transcriptional regulator n=1 Tax=Paeniglutamicibacter kerguelensis TaxID=254788 RepID=A0ABS4XAM1_9MICC|nr:TetR/AcrR family transcriptional regulator [Paeniglutamicibacter kerguelensis]MBP2385504.1 AcrR family transcriptional regulator [Paeniglutamicibacter kerguelensis]
MGEVAAGEPREPGPAGVQAPVGLREMKKQRTREAIAAAAMELFVSLGFDSTTVAEVARAAEVSEATVFNYFRTKEDLVFQKLDRFWDGMLAAIEDRPPASGIVDAVEGFLLERRPSAETRRERERLAAVNRMIAASPSLLDRERASYDGAAVALADVIARTTAAGQDAAAAAHMILGVHRSLVAFTRGQVRDGVAGDELARRVAERTRNGYALLRGGVDF